jgi:hypothetical protein
MAEQSEGKIILAAGEHNLSASFVPPLPEGKLLKAMLDAFPVTAVSYSDDLDDSTEVLSLSYSRSGKKIMPEDIESFLKEYSGVAEDLNRQIHGGKVFALKKRAGNLALTDQLQ